VTSESPLPLSARRSKQLAITVLGQPAGPRQMRFMGFPRSIWLERRVEAQDDVGHLLPGCSLGGCVEQPKIGRQMHSVIIGHLRLGWRGIGDGRVRRDWHDLLIYRLEVGVSPGSKALPRFDPLPSDTSTKSAYYNT